MTQILIEPQPNNIILEERITPGRERSIRNGEFLWDKIGLEFIAKIIADNSLIIEGKIDYKSLYKFGFEEKMIYESFTGSMAEHADEICSILQSYGLDVTPYDHFPAIILTDNQLIELVDNIINTGSINASHSIDYSVLANRYKGKRSEMSLRGLIRKHWPTIKTELKEKGVIVERVGYQSLTLNRQELALVLSENRYRFEDGRINWKLFRDEYFPDEEIKHIRNIFRKFINTES